MHIEVKSKPSYGMAVVSLEPGEAVVAESGSMVAYGPGVEVTTALNGTGAGGPLGWIKALVFAVVRRVLGGETLFVNRFTGTGPGARVMLAPAMVGDVHALPLTGGREITVQGSSFLASGEDVQVGLVWGGLQMLLSGEGAFFLRCRGTGELLLNAYGAIEEVQVEGRYVVDSGHVVAFEGDLSWSMGRAGGGWGTALLSGEGLVMTFEGRGTLYLQTRHLGSLVSWLTPLLP